MSHGADKARPRFVVAEFADSDALLAGTRKVREAGHKGVDTHTPYPIHGMEDALGLKRPLIPTIVLLAGLTGASLGYAMMVWMNAVDFPINIGNRPDHSAPAFVPITFEMMVLFGGVSAFLGSMALFRFPQPYHAVFEWDRLVERASVDGFFLSVEVAAGADAALVEADVKAAGATLTKVIEEPES